jgi:nucleoside-diphosphate-sugar epimerase
MILTPARIAVLGATGPTGRALASALVERGHTVRVVARRIGVLQTDFPSPQVEKRPGDAMDPGSLARALEGCDTVVDCIGLPGDRMADHPTTARNLARFVEDSHAHCVQVSSYWSFIPVRELPLSERHPREGGPPWACYRRAAEDILREAGAAIVHLPDFFGPHVHTSTLQMSMADAVNGKPMRWIGPTDVERDYVYVPDAMGIVAELVTRAEAYGDDWIVPGSGPISADALAGTLAKVLGRPVRAQATPPWLLRALSLFNKDLRGFMQLVPEYAKPIAYDGSKLKGLLGATVRTPYEDALHATIESLAKAR